MNHVAVASEVGQINATYHDEGDVDILDDCVSVIASGSRVCRILQYIKVCLKNMLKQFDFQQYLDPTTT